MKYKLKTRHKVLGAVSVFIYLVWIITLIILVNSVETPGKHIAWSVAIGTAALAMGLTFTFKPDFAFTVKNFNERTLPRVIDMRRDYMAVVMISCVVAFFGMSLCQVYSLNVPGTVTGKMGAVEAFGILMMLPIAIMSAYYFATARRMIYLDAVQNKNNETAKATGDKGGNN